MDDSIYKLINFKDFICNLFFENNMSYEDFYDGKNLKANNRPLQHVQKAVFQTIIFYIM